MIPNRSMPEAEIIPVLAYPDVNEAADWLGEAFGLEVRLENRSRVATARDYCGRRGLTAPAVSFGPTGP